MKTSFPTHFSGGGTICSPGFFVESIFADRYLHRTDFCRISLESLSSVKFQINEFFEFLFFRGLHRFKVLRTLASLRCFFDIFSKFGETLNHAKSMMKLFTKSFLVLV